MSFDLRVIRRLRHVEIDADFAVGHGLAVLVGPSGSGKTSILNLVAGLLRPDSGRIAVNGTTVVDRASGLTLPPEQRRIGYVFQDGRLFPHLRVRTNLLYGHRLTPPGDRWFALDEAVALLDIGHLLDRWPGSLSGGEARRVAIGRALLAGARALLMDEPLSSLDEARRDEVMQAIERIRDELRIPILYVTHDRAEAARLATNLIEVRREGESRFRWRLAPAAPAQ